MTKKLYILLLLTFGILLGPTQTFAHNNMKEMTCCKKESSTKSCCKEKQSKEEKKHNCDNGCKSVSCACPTVYCGFTAMLSFQTENNSLFDFEVRKQNYFYSEIIISSDFRSIWLPPKIS